VAKVTERSGGQERNPHFYGINEDEFRTMSARDAGRFLGEAWNKIRGMFRPGWETTQHAFRVWAKGRVRQIDPVQSMEEFKEGIKETYRPTPDPIRGNPYPGSGCPHTHFTELSEDLGKPLAAWIERRKHGAGWPRQCEENPMAPGETGLWGISRAMGYWRLINTNGLDSILSLQAHLAENEPENYRYLAIGTKAPPMPPSGAVVGYKPRMESWLKGMAKYHLVDLGERRVGNPADSWDLIDVKLKGRKEGERFIQATGVRPTQLDRREVVQAFKLWRQYDGAYMFTDPLSREDEKNIQSAWVKGYREAGSVHNPSKTDPSYKTFYVLSVTQPETGREVFTIYTSGNKWREQYQRFESAGNRDYLTSYWLKKGYREVEPPSRDQNPMNSKSKSVATKQLRAMGVYKPYVSSSEDSIEIESYPLEARIKQSFDPNEGPIHVFKIVDVHTGDTLTSGVVTLGQDLVRKVGQALMDFHGPAYAQAKEREAEAMQRSTGRTGNPRRKVAKVLFAVRVGNEDWQEELITDVEDRIEAASKWALANGFDRLRVATIDEGPPDFAATVRRNNPESDAAALYETFHGSPSTETLELTQDLHYHSHLTVLGDLVELKVKTFSGKQATISFSADDPEGSTKLCSNEAGTQLYIEGGDQSLDLAGLGFNQAQANRDSVAVGVLYELTYQTKKHFNKFKLTDYYHGLGEETGYEPILNYDTMNQLLTVSGGEYEIKPEGIVN
jgi:hypothetical protein